MQPCKGVVNRMSQPLAQILVHLVLPRTVQQAEHHKVVTFQESIGAFCPNMGFVLMNATCGIDAFARAYRAQTICLSSTQADGLGYRRRPFQGQDSEKHAYAGTIFDTTRLR